jgi:hypothetical protein
MNGYPYFVLYPPISAREGERRPGMRTTGYPDFDLCKIIRVAWTGPDSVKIPLSVPRLGKKRVDTLISFFILQ